MVAKKTAEAKLREQIKQLKGQVSLAQAEADHYCRVMDRDDKRTVNLPFGYKLVRPR